MGPCQRAYCCGAGRPKPAASAAPQDAEFFDIRNPVGQKLRHQALMHALDDMEAWLETGACWARCARHGALRTLPACSCRERQPAAPRTGRRLPDGRAWHNRVAPAVLVQTAPRWRCWTPPTRRRSAATTCARASTASGSTSSSSPSATTWRCGGCLLAGVGRAA